MKDILKATFVIIGTIIGAGFATGQEIYLFYGKAGWIGIITFLISCVISGFIIYKSLSFINKYEIKTYREFLEKILKRKKGVLINSIQLIVTCFLAICFIVMCVGAGAYFKQELGLPKIIGTTLMCLLCLLIFTKNTNGIVKLNEFAIPTLIFLIILIFFLTWNNNVFQASQDISKVKILLNPIIYASYNSIGLIPILIGLSKLVYKKSSITVLSIICATILTILGGMIFFIIRKVPNIQNIEIPLLYVAGKIGSFFSYLYGIAIFLAMLTSAVSEGFGFAQNLSKKPNIQFKAMILLCIITIMLGNFKFSSLVSILYPFFGYLGIAQMFFILIS